MNAFNRKNSKLEQLSFQQPNFMQKMAIAAAFALFMLIATLTQCAGEVAPVTATTSGEITSADLAVQEELTKLIHNARQARTQAQQAAEQKMSALEQKRLKDIADAEDAKVKGFWDTMPEWVNFGAGYLAKNGPWLIQTGSMYISTLADLGPFLFPSLGYLKYVPAIGRVFVNASNWDQTLQNFQMGKNWAGKGLKFTRGLLGSRDLLYGREKSGLVPTAWENAISPTLTLPENKALPKQQFMTFAQAETYIIAAKRKLELAQLEDKGTWGFNKQGAVQQRLAIAKEQFAIAKQEAMDSIREIINKNIADKELQNATLQLRILSILIGFAEVSIEVTRKEYEELYKKSWSLRYEDTFLQNPEKEMTIAAEQQKKVEGLLSALDTTKLSPEDAKAFGKIMDQKKIIKDYAQEVVKKLEGFIQFIEKDRAPRA